jgi:hypothetical protein
MASAGPLPVPSARSSTVQCGAIEFLRGMVLRDKVISAHQGADRRRQDGCA